MTAEIKEFTGHKWHRCNSEFCTLCHGGLRMCVICGGAEASLTTHCCRAPLSVYAEALIVNEGLDYGAGVGWHYPDGSPHIAGGLYQGQTA